MIFSAIVVFAICGAMLIMGGTFMDSDVLKGIGYLFWFLAAYNLIVVVVRFIRAAWHDYAITRYMREHGPRR